MKEVKRKRKKGRRREERTVLGSEGRSRGFDMRHRM